MINKEQLPVWGYDFCVCDNEMYIFHGMINALFKVDIDDGKVSYLTKIEGEPVRERSLFTSMVEWKKKIYMFPYNASSIVCYDVVLNKVRKIETKEYNVIDTFGNGRYVYMQPTFFNNYILKFDLEQEKVIKKIAITPFHSEQTMCSFNDNCYMGNGVYAVIITPANKICIIDSNSDSVHIVNIQNADDVYASIEYCDGYIYAMGNRKYSMAKIDPKSGNIVKTYKAFNGYGRLIGRIQDKIIVDMVYDKDMYTYNCTDQKVNECRYVSKRDADACKYYWYSYGVLKKCNKDVNYYLNRYDSTIVCNFMTAKEKKIQLKASDEDYEINKKNIVEDISKCECEGEFIGLDDYLKYI